jgi:NDP-sugar pyrophosphorylase family protein
MNALYRNIRVLIVSGGLGKRFSDKGYTLPKPFLDMNGRQMIDVIIEQLPIGLKSVDVLFSNASLKLAPKNQLANVMYVDRDEEQHVTGLKGMAAGVLYTLKHRRDYKEDPILLLSCDQFVSQQALVDFLRKATYEMIVKNHRYQGSLLTFYSEDKTDLKWSFCVKGENGLKQVVEKPETFVSHDANTGVYFFANSSLLLQAILKDTTANLAKRGAETYIAPLYNHFINSGFIIDNFSIAKGTDFIPLGVPEEFEEGVEILKARGII